MEESGVHLTATAKAVFKSKQRVAGDCLNKEERNNKKKKKNPSRKKTVLLKHFPAADLTTFAFYLDKTIKDTLSQTKTQVC